MANKTVTVLLKAITGAYRAEMTKAAAATAQVGTAAGNVGKAQAFLTRTLGPTGVAAAKVAVGFGLAGGLAGGLVQSLKASIDFERDFTRVRKTVDAGRFELDRLALGFRKMATEIPTSTEELTRVGEAAGQLGIEKRNILSFSKTMVDLGNTTNLAAEDAAVALARLANITQMPQTEFRTLGSVLVELGNNFATTEAEIAEMATRLAGAGAQIGLTEAEILAFATTLSSVGIRAEAGGSAFSRVFTRIQTAVMEGSAELDLFAQVAGQTAEDFARSFERRPAAALEAFITGFGRLQDAGVNTEAVLRALNLSEIRVSDSIRRTAGAGDLLTNALQSANDELADTDALNVEAARHAETTAAKLTVLRNKVKDLAIGFGDELKPGIDLVIDVLDDLDSASSTGIFGGARSFGEIVGNAFRDLFDASRNVRGEVDRAGQSFRRTGQDVIFLGEVMSASEKKSRLAALELQEVTRANNRASVTTRETSDAVDVSDEAFKKYAGTVEGAAKQMAAIEKATEELQGSIEAFFDPLKNYNDLLEAKTEKERATAEASAEASKTTKDSWEDWMGVVEVTGRDVIKGMQDQINAFRDWRKNLSKIAKAGRGDIAAELAAMGPEGAGLVAAWAGMTDAEFKEAGRLWDIQNKQSAKKVERTLKGGLKDAAKAARRGGMNIKDAFGEEVAEMLKNWETTVNLLPDHLASRLKDTEREGDKGAKNTADAIEKRTDRGRRNYERIINTLPPSLRSTLRQAERAGDRGAKNTADVIEKRTDRGRRNYERIINTLPPSLRSTLKTAEDRGRTGATNTVNAINTRAARGVGRWGRIIDTYAESLAKGLNPVIVQIGGKKISFGSADAARIAGRAAQFATLGRAQGGIDDPRPSAFITQKPVVLFGEPETGGEAYIPFAPNKRPRSRRIADETVRRLGGQVEWFANGGLRAPPFTDKREHALERRLEMMSQFLIGGIVEAGRAIRRMGFLVGEHPAFGGVAPVHVPNSYHYRGLAIDVNWPGSSEARRLDFLKSWILGNVQRNLIRELIWRAPGHWGHLHLAMSRSGGGGAFIPGGSGGAGFIPMPDLPKVPSSDDTVFGDTAVDAMRHVRSMAISFLEKKLMAFGGAGAVPGSGGGGSIRGIVQAVARTFGWGSGTQWNSLANLVTRESSWRPTAQNPTSTASGLFQFLDGTWAGTGIRKTSDPRLQTIAGLRYIRSRYGSPAGAWNFWQRNRWYEEGGLHGAPGAVPAFASGTDFVPQTGLALVHRGERITPASENRPLASFPSDAQRFDGAALRPGDQLMLVVEGEPLTAVVDRRLRQQSRRSRVVARKGQAT